jgi:aspartate carbamoyltransferase regulatory subunit
MIYIIYSNTDAVVQWLRHCATNRKVAESIPDGVIGIFHCHNPSGRTIALGLNQPLNEISTWGMFLGVKTADAYG